MSAIRILHVEDDATFGHVLARELTHAGFDVRTHPSAEGAAELVVSYDPHVLLLDLRLPGADGIALLARIREQDPDLPVILLTAHGGVPDAVAAIRLGAYDFLVKPTRLDVLEQALRRAAERRELVLENRRLRRAASTHDDPIELLGDGEPMQALRHLIDRIAGSDAPVLVCGEPGSGKELIARNLHVRGPRHGAPFVVVNCGALPDDLVESELFGHERGAFTGAERKRTGLFEAARGGTLFLDEVGELPLAVQPVLLRAIQFGEVRPVGSAASHKVDVRVVAATNRDLRSDVERKAFREDLFYRLSTFSIEAPPLRAHAADVPLLARRFLARLSARTERPLALQESALARLADHPWPGNVRELESAMTRLAYLCPSPAITAADVDAFAFGATPAGRGELPTLRLEELERLAIDAALARHGGDKRAAARTLGISLRTLYNRLEARATPEPPSS